MTPIPAAILCAFIGLALGSFLNVCITRLPQRESIVSPPSHCPKCLRPIRWRDNIPLLSWILLRGRCRACGENIPPRYPLIEASTAAVFFLLCLKFWPSWRLAPWALFCFLLLGLAAMDWEAFLLPDRFTLPGLAAGIAYRGVAAGVSEGWLHGFNMAATALANAAVAAGVLLVIAGSYRLLRHKPGMGLGDVKLAAMLAAWLGLPLTAVSFVLALVAGALFGLGLLTTSRLRTAQGPRASEVALPFGAFLSAAAIYTVFLGDRTLSWYLQFFH